MVIMDFLRKALNKALPQQNGTAMPKISIATSTVMDTAITEWNRMYENKPWWRGGEESVVTLNLPAAISEEMARLALTEFSIELSGSPRADFLNDQLKENLLNLSVHMESYCALGGICMKPYVSGETIKVDFTDATRFFPTAYNSNMEVTGAAFIESKRQGDYLYTRVEWHNLVGTDYTVINRAFKSNKITSHSESDDDFVNNPYQETCDLAEVSEWAHLSEDPVVMNNIERPLFVYVRIPRANNIDRRSPLGASIYSRAAEIIEQADRQFSRILWEYIATEAAIHASGDLFDMTPDGKPIFPRGHERLYRDLDISKSENFIKEYLPQIRDASLFAGLNKYFQRIEFLCGLSYGTISDPQTIEKTAEEIRLSKQRSFTVVNRIQDAWDNAFDRLIYGMETLSTLYHLAPLGNVEKTITWGDGVLEDFDKEYQRRLGLVMANMMKKEDFLGWWMGCSPEEALEKMPQQEVAAIPMEE